MNYLPLILSAFGLLISIGALTLNYTRSRRLDALMKNAQTSSLEKHLANLVEYTSSLDPRFDHIENELAKQDARVITSMRGFGFVRFHAFGNNDGGKQSFALALLNEKGDGILISSLWARERMSLFSKEVSNFVSSQTLSDEEGEAIEKAKKSL